MLLSGIALAQHERGAGSIPSTPHTYTNLLRNMFSTYLNFHSYKYLYTDTCGGGESQEKALLFIILVSKTLSFCLFWC